ncbi:hypothetical protein INT45_007542 [Circinella minor]|uniref:DDE Tnp4 domain-containing protein n=1 Tax=Circinella minor TaxID=1195481 RepID=A0A8H7S5T2_9FUNG|nr:hypothetical protein INT45_007542 [Circinella minor]
MNNRTLIGQDPCTDACIMQCQTNLAVIQGTAYHRRDFQHLMDAMMEEEEELLTSHRNYLQVIDQMSFEVLGPLVAQAALSAFELLVNKLKSDPEYIGSQMKGGIPVEIQVAVVLWCFANSHFGFRLIDLLRKWNEWIRQKSPGQPMTYEECRRWHTNLKQKEEQGINDWIKKNNASFNLLAVCNVSTCFTFIKCGDSGRVNDACAFTTSALYTNLINIPDQVCMDDTYIITDSAFPVMRTVVPSFPRSSANRRQKIFNKMHSSSRIIVEHSFGALVKRMIWTIIACCVLHNICLGVNDVEDPVTQSDATVHLYEAFVDDGPYDVDPEGQGIEVSLEPLPLVSEASSPHPVPEAPRLTTDHISIPEITRLENELQLEGQAFRSELLDAYVPVEEQPTTTERSRAPTRSPGRSRRLTRRALQCI